MDWNADGYKDILVGDRDGYVTFFQRNSNGSLMAGVKLKSNGQLLDIGGNSSPDFVDWDNDGDLDMIIGTYLPAKPRLYFNTGTASSYQFGGYIDYAAAGRYALSYPSIGDINGDGLFDVVIGTSIKTFLYYENKGTAGHPTFARKVNLLYQNGTKISGPGGSRPEIADWNSDGLMDIISGYDGSGASDDFVYLYLAIPPVAVEENSSDLIASTVFHIIENPVRSNLSIFLHADESTVSDLTIYNMNGRIVLAHGAEELNPGCNTLIIPSSIPNGAYVLRCVTANSESAERFIIAR